jgi:ATP-dependent DNA helicase RecG
MLLSLLSLLQTSEGGKVMVGVLDNGELCGVHVGPETIQRYINEIKTSTYPQLFPSVKIIEKEGHAVLLFAINEYPVKPVAYKNRYYKKLGVRSALGPILAKQESKVDSFFTFRGINSRQMPLLSVE